MSKLEWINIFSIDWAKINIAESLNTQFPGAELEANFDIVKLIAWTKNKNDTVKSLTTHCQTQLQQMFIAQLNTHQDKKSRLPGVLDYWRRRLCGKPSASEPQGGVSLSLQND